MMVVFWVVAPCSLVEVYQRFGGPCCLHHQGDESPETLVDFYQTARHDNPEDNHLRTHRRENLKFYLYGSWRWKSTLKLTIGFNCSVMKLNSTQHTTIYTKAETTQRSSRINTNE
jgi:hypothetical protein